MIILVLINANMDKMCRVLDAIWQQLQDKHSPLQQSDAETAANVVDRFLLCVRR